MRELKIIFSCKHLISGIFIFFTIYAEAQSDRLDSNFYFAAFSESVNTYFRNIGDQAEIFNGLRYTGYLFQFRTGTPFFNSGKTDTGSVFYDSMLFTGLSLYFDDLSGLVIIDDNGYKIELNNKKLDALTIGSHEFTRLEKIARNWGEFDPGFYEILHRGLTTDYKKTLKRVVDDLSGVDIAEKSVTATDHYYIEKDSVVTMADNLKEIEAAFKDKKNEIAHFVRQHKLKPVFRKDPDNAIIQIAAYYDQLSGQLNIQRGN